MSISKRTWVVVSGATNHMTQSSHRFVSYSPCPSNKKIATADGTLVTVAGRGDVVINQNFTLKNVLHVAKLSTNLVSIHKLTKDLNCVVTFSSILFKFMDQSTWTMIGLARKMNGLYFFEELTGKNSTKDPILLSLLSRSSLSNKNSM
ncbi:hypothetical protein PanWU01x14_336080 [Parasponia andersonii]|uniref:Retrovirus-related Pol polyprotein from transposon TNT 1-94-like beta-barrel domain-containing protein n=1 Tax=Parasponia andersonii TaxID=3476 RepID=A0A2P5AG12_PARAD|nr:hypothetical protein PanWU01x14_336080 [Parasponia andersonii]